MIRAVPIRKRPTLKQEKYRPPVATTSGLIHAESDPLEITNRMTRRRRNKKKDRAAAQVNAKQYGTTVNGSHRSDKDAP